jgi:8-oxo-dGTP pyrophosphatase MutT (NUDIX family)
VRGAWGSEATWAGFESARMRVVATQRDSTPEPRRAATVVVARPGRGDGSDGEGSGGGGVEVLMLRRARSNRFAPGFVVFPGGVVEPDDARLAELWFGDPGESARAGAIRELAEEARLAATAEGVRALHPDEDALDVISSSPPQAGAVPQMARWIAPESLPVRFDAHFFALAAPAGVVATPDRVEVDIAEWRVPAKVLDEHRLYETILWPTFRTLQWLSGCRSVDHVLALRVRQEPPPLGGHGWSPEWGRDMGSFAEGNAVLPAESSERGADERSEEASA